VAHYRECIQAGKQDQEGLESGAIYKCMSE